MKMSAPRAVGELIRSALPQISDRLVDLRIRQAWASIVGRDAARRTHPDGLAGGTLRVVVDNSPWLHELTLRADEFTAKVHERFRDVERVRFVLGAIDADAAPAPEKPARA